MVDFIELKDIKKQQRKEKTQKFLKRIGKGAGVIVKKTGEGAREIGTRVVKGAGTLIQKAKEAQSPEAQEARLAAQEKRLVFQERIAKRRARIQKLQPRGAGLGSMPGLSGGGGGGDFLGGGGQGFGLKPLDMSNVLTGESPRKKGRGKPFDPLSQI